MEMNLESIDKYVNEKVGNVDFHKLLTEAEPEDAPEEDLGGGDDAPADDDLGGDDDFGGADDLGGDDVGDFGGDPGGGSSGDSGESLGDEEEAVDNKYADREDDQDYIGSKNDAGSAAEGNPAGSMIYDVEGVLNGINDTVSTAEVNLAEIDKAKNVLEVVANGKKLIDADFDEIKDYQSFSDIINRALFQVDDKTQNYFKMKIKAAILAVQNRKKIDSAKKDSEVDSMRELASKF